MRVMPESAEKVGSVMPMPLSRSEWTLLTIASAEGRPLTPVQLQKSLFLLGRELPAAVGPDFYQFEPYDYGPFDATIYRDAEALAEQGLIDIQPAPHARYNQYRATLQGLEQATALKRRAPVQAVTYLSTIVEWARSLTFPELVRAIYARYPEYRSRSVFSG